MSELNKKLSALSRQQQGQNKDAQQGIGRIEIKPATVKPVQQTNLKPWATLGVLSLGVIMGIGGWQLWSSDKAVGEVVMAVSPVAPAEAASAPLVEETPVIAEAPAEKVELKSAVDTAKPVANVEPKPTPVQQPALKAPVDECLLRKRPLLKYLVLKKRLLKWQPLKNQPQKLRSLKLPYQSLLAQALLAPSRLLQCQLNPSQQ